MKKRLKSSDENKWSFVESRKDRYVRIPKKFIKKIHLDSERNVVLKSNKNVWFFEIKDKNEENNIFEETKVTIDKKWGFIVPVMSFMLERKPRVEEIMFFDDDNGIGCGNSGAYSVWANGKLNEESNNAQDFKTMEEMDDFIRDELKKIRGENEEKTFV